MDTVVASAARSVAGIGDAAPIPGGFEPRGGPAPLSGRPGHRDRTAGRAGRDRAGRDRARRRPPAERARPAGGGAGVLRVTGDGPAPAETGPAETAPGVTAGEIRAATGAPPAEPAAEGKTA
ncbi:hypothetical protein [Actinomadura roseirufa]|uniref:hypothetical protein n=1 Tax=Actinomadura roseirufa TaxID=2094049 RepID=UPI00104115AE|nr:hypothetical protein [Actinomadura roseirufa]